MVRSASFVMMLLAWICFQIKLPKKPEYIEFMYIGDMDTKPMRPVYISTTKLHIEMDSSQHAMLIEQLRIAHKTINEEIKERFMDTQYNFIVTDSKTYASLHSFLINHKNFYYQFFDMNGSGDDLGFNMDQKPFVLKSKTIDSFFDQIARYLKSRYCDKKVIQAIKEL